MAERRDDSSSEEKSNMEQSSSRASLSPRKKQKSTEVALDDVIIDSEWKDLSSEEQSKAILESFNAGIKKDDSCFEYNPAPGRALHRVDVSKFLLGHRNQIAELADPNGRRIALKFTADPLITIKSKGSVLKTAPFFGCYGKYVLNVPAGYYAKAFSKNHPVLYGEGPHVIIDPTFKFDENSGFVSQIEPYIQHATIHILRVPAGKVARAWVGTEPRLLESRRDPYVFVDSQFKLLTRDSAPNKLDQLFESATAQYIEHGSIKRVIPHTGEVAITYNNGILHIIPPPVDSKPVIINSATHNFDGFISTALQTCLFPSEFSKNQTLKDNPRVTADERNLKILQTRDSLRVGVQLVVAFKIKQPDVAITKLGKDGILPHIENIAFADMGKAIQLSTLQEVMYFTQNKPKSKDEVKDNAQEGLQTIQDHVKQNLAHDLEDYGIELARLNIETIKVMDEEIAKKLAGQSVTSAEYTTKQATLVKEYDIKTTEAKLRADTDNIALQQKNQALISQAQAKLDAAQREAQASLILADAQRKAAEMQGELYTKYPQLLELEMLRIKAEALKGATVYITPNDMGNVFNSPVNFFNAMAAQPKKNNANNN